eukprot:3309601-Ditylum_brightwellii.AAC.1
MPILQADDGTWTTPLELVCKTRPDWWNLVPMFILSYVKKSRDAKGYRATADSQSIKAICVGNNKKSNGLLFYLSSTQSLISSSEYMLNPTVLSGPAFNIYYNGWVGFDLYRGSSKTFCPLSTKQARLSTSGTTKQGAQIRGSVSLTI